MSVPIEGRSPASIPVEVSVALHDWGRQLSHLRTIFRNYEDTCTKLYEYLNPSSSALAAHHLEELYLVIDHSFGIMDTLERSLHRTRRGLGALRNHSTQLAPINCLHPELLSYIFILAQEQQEFDIAETLAETMAETGESEASEFDHPTPLPLVVSQVSRRWRTIALDTANLWTKLDFSDGPPYHYSKILLERSKAAPLNIALSMNAADNQAGIDAVMDLIVPQHSSRVTTLSIDAISLNQIDWILSRFITGSDELPPIVDLSLSEENETGEPVQISVRPEHVPRLATLTTGIQRLSLSGVQLPWHSSAFNNLTHFRFEKNPGDVRGSRPSEQQFINFLNASPQLRYLAIHETGIVMDDPEHPEHCLRHPFIEMAELQTLEFQEVSWHEITFVLHTIRAPTLCELSICSPENREDHDGNILDNDIDATDEAMFSAIFKFLATLVVPGKDAKNDVCSPLTVLTLETIMGGELGSERLTSILSLVPQLQRLSLSDIVFDDTVLRQMQGAWGLLHVEQERGNLCPELMWLRISGVGNITQEAIYDLVSSRSRQGKPIVTLKLIDIGDDDEVDLNKLKNRLKPFVENLYVSEDGLVL